MKNPNKCLNCNCDTKRDNQGITRQNFKYNWMDTQETICLKCYNKGIDFDNMKGGLKEDD